MTEFLEGLNDLCVGNLNIYLFILNNYHPSANQKEQFTRWSN